MLEEISYFQRHRTARSWDKFFIPYFENPIIIHIISGIKEKIIEDMENYTHYT